jgi:hypothetical protein
MRWPNGGPPKLYAIIVNKTGKVHAFERKEFRTEWMVKHHPTFIVGDYVYLTYVQQEK